jgi:hypothetical protein
MVRSPGVYDLKVGLAQMVYALRALSVLGLEPSVTPAVFVNSDEEVRSRDSGRRIRRLACVVERAFVLEPSLGPWGAPKTARKGVGRFTLMVEGRAAHAGLDPGGGASAILIERVLHGDMGRVRPQLLRGQSDRVTTSRAGPFMAATCISIPLDRSSVASSSSVSNATASHRVDIVDGGEVRDQETQPGPAGDRVVEPSPQKGHVREV